MILSAEFLSNFTGLYNITIITVYRSITFDKGQPSIPHSLSFT